MRIFYGFNDLPQFRNPTATVGSYDGVHGGHMTLLNKVIQTARAEGGESIVLTFDPHPRVTLGQAEGLWLLTTIEEKAHLLDRVGIDMMIVIPFNEAFSRLSPHDFINNYLIRRVGVKNLVVGYNHRFGHDKEGDYNEMERLHETCGFRVVRMTEYNPNSEKVSSTAIRRLIQSGDMAHLAQMMPHPYIMIGHVDGTEIQIDEPLKLLPPAGCYPVTIDQQRMMLTIDAQGRLHLNRDLPKGKVVINFES